MDSGVKDVFVRSLVQIPEENSGDNKLNDSRDLTNPRYSSNDTNSDSSTRDMYYRLEMNDSENARQEQRVLSSPLNSSPQINGYTQAHSNGYTNNGTNTMHASSHSLVATAPFASRSTKFATLPTSAPRLVALRPEGSYISSVLPNLYGTGTRPDSSVSAVSRGSSIGKYLREAEARRRIEVARTVGRPLDEDMEREAYPLITDPPELLKKSGNGRRALFANSSAQLHLQRAIEHYRKEYTEQLTTIQLAQREMNRTNTRLTNKIKQIQANRTHQHHRDHTAHGNGLLLLHSASHNMISGREGGGLHGETSQKPPEPLEFHGFHALKSRQSQRPHIAPRQNESQRPPPKPDAANFILPQRSRTLSDLNVKPGSSHKHVKRESVPTMQPLLSSAGRFGEQTVGIVNGIATRPLESPSLFITDIG